MTTAGQRSRGGLRQATHSVETQDTFMVGEMVGLLGRNLREAVEGERAVVPRERRGLASTLAMRRLVPREGAGTARAKRSGEGLRRPAPEADAHRRSRAPLRPALTAVCYNGGALVAGVRR